jgi:hypothetical protein
VSPSLFASFPCVSDTMCLFSCLFSFPLLFLFLFLFCDCNFLLFDLFRIYFLLAEDGMGRVSAIECGRKRSTIGSRLLLVNLIPVFLGFVCFLVFYLFTHSLDFVWTLRITFSKFQLSSYICCSFCKFFFNLI